LTRFVADVVRLWLSHEHVGRTLTSSATRLAMALPLLSYGRSLVTSSLIALVRSYQVILRPILPSVCRFYPSCSDYFILAVQKHGPWRGGLKGLWRICRCHPWQTGGVDLP
jgi:putative membrane protein insertion efficiency factor